jgi:hypothetical protein
MYNNKGITAFNAMEKFSNKTSPFSGSKINDTEPF